MPVKSKRSRARRGEGARLREEIVEAAAHLANENGSPSAVSIRGLAGAVGVTPPALYLHFKDKDEILLAAAHRHFEALEHELGALLDSGSDELEVLAAASRAYVRFGAKHRGLYDLLARAGAGSHPPGFDHLVSAVRRCVDAGALEGDPEEIAALLWSALHGLVLTKGRLSTLDDDALERFLDVQIEGLLSV
jgi:AcrR family transcriptional regulator